MKHQILEDSTGTISCRFDRRPSACTVALCKPDGTVLTAAGAVGVTLGAQCTIGGDSGYSESNRRLLTLSATGYGDLVLHRPYLIRNASQQQEIVQLTKLPADYATLVAEELEYDYAANDTLEDCLVERAITAVEAADVDVNYRARFTATVSGDTVIRDVLFDVVKSVIYQPITVDNLSDWAPTIARQQPAEIAGTDWSRQLTKSWELVYDDLVTQQLHPNRLLDEKQLAILHYHRFMLLLARNGITTSSEIFPNQAIKDHSFEYANQMQLIRTQLTWYDKDEDLIVDGGESNETPEQQYPRFNLG